MDYVGWMNIMISCLSLGSLDWLLDVGCLVYDWKDLWWVGLVFDWWWIMWVGFKMCWLMSFGLINRLWIMVGFRKSGV